MNILLEKGIIEELANGENFGYILSDNEQFLSTEYKVLQSQNSNFIRCIKLQYNEKTELLYILDGCRSLESMISNLDENAFLSVITSLFNNVIEVKDNGFLSCQNIDISFDKIFADPNTMKVKLVYLPTREKLFEDYLTFENELRAELIKLINSQTILNGSKIAQLVTKLSDGTLTLKDLLNNLKGVKNNESVLHNQYFKNTAKTIRLVALNEPFRVNIVVNKREFIIGKNAAIVDGAITFNKAISRIHCKIILNGEQYAIMDLNSANGTYVNGRRLSANESCQIRGGDIVRLANSDFEIVTS